MFYKNGNFFTTTCAIRGMCVYCISIENYELVASFLSFQPLLLLLLFSLVYCEQQKQGKQIKNCQRNNKNKRGKKNLKNGENNNNLTVKVSHHIVESHVVNDDGIESPNWTPAVDTSGIVATATAALATEFEVHFYAPKLCRFYVFLFIFFIHILFWRSESKRDK